MQQRILFINHPEGDYGGAFLYNGLCQTLGAENVYDCPIKKSYHGQTHRYSIPAIENGCTCPFAWMPIGHTCAWESADLTKDETIAEAEELLRHHFFSLVIVESLRQTSIETLRKLLPAIKNSGIKIVIHDGEDYWNIDSTLIAEFYPAAYLKRERPKGSAEVSKENGVLFMAFPFSAPIPFSPTALVKEDIQYDVALMFGDTFKLRRDLVNEFRNSFDGKMYTAISSDSEHTQGLQQWEDYLRVMATAHMGVSARGFGRDTCRYWEVPLVTAMLCDDVDLCIPFPFINGETCFMYDSPKDAVDVVRKYAGTELCEMVYHSGLEHLRKHHTNKARVEYLFNVLKNEEIL